MGDGLKLSKEKRHRSSSSIAGALLEGTRSERKINVRGEHSNSVTRDSNAYSGAASIPEVEDQFVLAEARCDQLQDKIDLVKALKRKRKNKKRSLTRVNEAAAEMPLISVRTQPKKKAAQVSGRPKQVRGYVEPAVEHHAGKPPRQGPEAKKKASNADMRTPKSLSGRRSVRGDGGDRQPAPGTSGISRGVKRPYPNTPALGRQHKAPSTSGYSLQGESFRNMYPPYLVPQMQTQLQSHRGSPDLLKADRRTRAQPVPVQQEEYSDAEFYDPGIDNEFYPTRANAPSERRHRYTPREVLQKDSSQSAATKWSNDSSETKKTVHGRNATPSPPLRRGSQRRPPGATYMNMNQQQSQPQQHQQEEERAVVELFSKRASPEPQRRRKSTPRGMPDGDIWNLNQASDNETRFVNLPSEKVAPMETSFHDIRMPRRVKYRTRRYELPTVASQMKQAGTRFYYGANGGNQIPFVVTKSTAPSHNIGVNIQQVLNGLKIQQPLTGIPLTIAHHMGLRHMPYNTRSETINARPQEPTLDHREINMIQVGRRLVRLPSYKYISYNRLLAMFREGDGMVPRFLRAMNRPHCFYSSMYNLATHRTASTTKCGYNAEAKQALAEYAALYREYELLEQRLKDGGMEPERVARRDELARELSSREGHIRRVVHDYKSVALPEGIRASHSTAGSGRRHSTFKLNLSEPHN